VITMHASRRAGRYYWKAVLNAHRHECHTMSADRYRAIRQVYLNCLRWYG
jgi:hypothetical protein